MIGRYCARMKVEAAWFTDLVARGRASLAR